MVVHPEFPFGSAITRVPARNRGESAGHVQAAELMTAHVTRSPHGWPQKNGTRQAAQFDKTIVAGSDSKTSLDAHWDPIHPHHCTMPTCHTPRQQSRRFYTEESRPEDSHTAMWAVRRRCSSPRGRHYS
jgi:hypothetical protein